MTTERDDKRVSDAYRGLAGESTPATLDRRILELAAREARSRYGLARAWIRPVAWAATIGLSLTFMLEMTVFDKTPPDGEPPAPALSRERGRQDAAVMKSKQESDTRLGIANHADAPAETASAASIAEDAGVATQAASIAAEAGIAPPAEPARTAPAADETLPLRRAEQRALGQTEATAATAPSAYGERLQSVTFCDDDARRSAEEWYACVLKLGEQGLVDAAAAELEALRRAFPDFREPPSK